MAGKVTFRPTREDYINSVRQNYVRLLRSLAFYRRILIYAFVAATIVAIVPIAFGEPIVRALIVATSASVVGALAGIVCALINLQLIPRRAGRLFEQQRSLHRDMQFMWDDAGTFWKTERAETTRPWSDYHRWQEGRDCYLIYLNDSLFEFVPRRVLSPTDDEDLRSALAASNVSHR